MLATFRETVASIKDPAYGSVILQKTIKSAIWYWSKYLILLGLIPAIISIFTMTRFIPEIPKIITENIADGTIGAKDGKLFTTMPQPLNFGAPEFPMIFDVSATQSAIDNLEKGLLIMSDKVVIKEQPDSVKIQKLEKLPDFSTDKYQIADWVKTNRTKIWLFGFTVIFLITQIAILFTGLWRLLSSLIWAGIILLVDRSLLRKNFGNWSINKPFINSNLGYPDYLKLILYASVPSLLISSFGVLFLRDIFSLISLGVSVYFIFTWISHLPKQPSK